MKRLEADAPRVAPSPETVEGELPLTVLDTNVVLDWLVFDEPRARPLIAAITASRLRWLTTQAILVEQRHVFASFAASRWRADPQALEAACARWSRIVEAPIVVRAPRCSDADDQVFIDLALAHRARWLVTRDRALLKLARRMRAFGTEVLTPAAWAATNGA